jgi:hypothetical protein
LNKTKHEWSVRPEPEQELLLRAALLKGEEAIEAWRQWKSGVDIERLDPASHRILPLLYRNLLSLGVEDLSMGKYKGVYRQTWYRNQLLFHSLASVVRSFRDADIETIVLKGAALIVLNYKDYGLRPMNDFDILIHTHQVSAAINLLRVLGWTPVDFEPTEGYISVSYSHGFRNGKGQELDLHWHVLSQSREMDADKDFWDGAIAVDIHGVATRALNPADQLLHVCIHGARWNYTPPFRWVADAAIILNTERSEFDWDRLIDQSRQRRLVLPLKESLNYLNKSIDIPIPRKILNSINGLHVPRIERMEYRVITNPPTRLTAGLDLWCQHYRLTGDSGILYKLMTFPSFLEKIWSLDSLWKLPLYGLRKISTSYKKRPKNKLDKQQA